MNAIGVHVILFMQTGNFDITTAQAFQEKLQTVQNINIFTTYFAATTGKILFWKTFSSFKKFTSLIINELKLFLENFINS